MILVATRCCLISFSPNVSLVQKINTLPITPMAQFHKVSKYQPVTLHRFSEHRCITPFIHVLPPFAGELPPLWIPSRSAAGVTITCIYKRTFWNQIKIHNPVTNLEKKKRESNILIAEKGKGAKKFTDFVKN